MAARVIAILAAILICVLLYSLPRQSATKRNEVQGTSQIELSDVEQAVEKVANGTNPMEGILELRAIADGDSTNVEAQFYLGKFAVQSGQYDKAIERFNNVTRLTPENPDGWWELASLDFEMGQYASAAQNFGKTLELDSTFYNAIFFQGKCYELLGDTALALQKYERFIPLSTDTVVVKGIERMMTELRH
jgi:tetratricopeptide (TPR) repeat protein